MLCQRPGGTWETAPMEKPYGRGVIFQVYLSSIDPVIDRLKDLRVPIYAVRGEHRCGFFNWRHFSLAFGTLSYQSYSHYGTLPYPERNCCPS